MSLLRNVIKLAKANPELRDYLMPIIRKHARGLDEFDLEGSDFGLQVAQRHGDQFEVGLYFPTQNIGRRGKMVAVRYVHLVAMTTNTAWGWEIQDKLKRASNAAQANTILDSLLEEATQAGDKVYTDRTSQEKGISSDLPVPKAQQVGAIRGRDITVDLNAKPIEVYSDSESEKLEQSHQRYWVRIHPRFKRVLQALAPQLEKAPDLKAAMAIFKDNGIPVDKHTYMDPMYD
jgi:hypothetical protein